MCHSFPRHSDGLTGNTQSYSGTKTYDVVRAVLSLSLQDRTGYYFPPLPLENQTRGRSPAHRWCDAKIADTWTLTACSHLPANFPILSHASDSCAVQRLIGKSPAER